VRRLLPLAASAAALVVLVAPTALAAPADTPNEVVYISDASGNGDTAVVLRDLSTRRATVVLPAEADYLYESPELSPDATRVALATNRGSADDAQEGIAVVDRAGTGLRRLTEPASLPGRAVFDTFPKWSPTGDRILFTRVTLTGSGASYTASSALFTVRATGAATVTAVTGSVRGFTGEWNPDGSEIVYASLPEALPPGTFPSSGTLSAVRTDGSGARSLGVEGAFPAFSPDARTVAYSMITQRDAARGDTAKIAVIPRTGGATNARVFAATQPSAAPSVASTPSWTPDGRALVYQRFGYDRFGDPTGSDLWGIDSAGVRAGRVIATRAEELEPFVQGGVPGGVAKGGLSTFTPVTPKRVLDTRKGVGGPTAKIGAGGTLTLPIAGLATSAGPVPENTTAVVLNVTIANASDSTDVRVYPSGSPVPSASNVNAPGGAITPNLVTTRVGADGAVVLRNSAGAVDLIADIAGYYTPDDDGVGFAAVDPGRILDTRRGLGAAAGKVGQTPLTVKVTGTLSTSTGGAVSVPRGASAVVLNVTSTQSTLSTDVRVYPTAAGVDPPLVSNLNVRAGKDTANLVTVAVGAGGTVQMLNRSGDTHLIADIAGYYGGGAENRFVPVDPARFLDTRAGIGAAPIPTTGGDYVQVDVGGTRDVPTAAVAAVLNITGTGTTGNTDVRVYPVGIAPPLVSNLNLARGDTRANLAIVRLGTGGELRLLNRSASVNLIGDLAGYMIPPT